MFFCLLILLFFSFKVFPFPPSKAQFLGDVSMNSESFAPVLYYFCFCAMEQGRNNEEKGDEEGDGDGDGDGDVEENGGGEGDGDRERDVEM
jgi:hypothetical protein